MGAISNKSEELQLIEELHAGFNRICTVKEPFAPASPLQLHWIKAVVAPSCKCAANDQLARESAENLLEKIDRRFEGDYIARDFVSQARQNLVKKISDYEV
jgi:hypothetical protein